MTTDLSRFWFLGTVGGLAWMMLVFFLIWAYPSKGQVPGKEMIVRYVFTMFLLFVLQIAALGVTFLLHSSRQSTYLELTQQHPHAGQPSN